MRTFPTRKHIVVSAIMAVAFFIPAISLAAQSKPDKVDEANWKQANTIGTVEAYMDYLRKVPGKLTLGRHVEEARGSVKRLVQTDLANTKEVSIAIEPATDSASKALMDAGLMKAISAAIEAQGYKVVESTSPYQVTVSVAQERFLSGSSTSYWHFSSMQNLTIAVAKAGIGPLFRNTVSLPVKSDQATHQFPSISVKPLSTDQRPETYIDPDAGTAWGAGVEMTGGSRDPNVIAADQKAFKEFNWSSLVDVNESLDSLVKALQTSPPLRIVGSTDWSIFRK
jgi:hypothetical protein